MGIREKNHTGTKDVCGLGAKYRLVIGIIWVEDKLSNVLQRRHVWFHCVLHRAEVDGMLLSHLF